MDTRLQDNWKNSNDIFDKSYYSPAHSKILITKRTCNGALNKMSEVKRARNDVFSVLKSHGFNEAEAAIIISLANANHPVPETYLIEQTKRFVEELSGNESPLVDPLIAEALPTLREVGIIGETNYYTQFKCYYLCPLNSVSLVSKLSKMKGADIRKDSSEKLLGDLTSLAEHKQEIGFTLQDHTAPIRRFVPTKCFYDVNSPRGNFSLEESKKYLEELSQISDKIMQNAKPNGEIRIKSFYTGWLARKQQLIRTNLAKGVSFLVVILPKPPGSGGKEWADDVKLLFSAFKGAKKKLKLRVWPVDVRDHTGLMPQMTIIDNKHAIVFQRRLGDDKICSPCYSDINESVAACTELFQRYNTKSLFWHLVKVAESRVMSRSSLIFGTVAAILGALIGTLWSFAGLILGGIIGATGGVILPIPLMALKDWGSIQWSIQKLKRSQFGWRPSKPSFFGRHAGKSNFCYIIGHFASRLITSLANLWR